MQASKHLKRLIAANRTQEAIDILLGLTETKYPALHKELILHSGNLNSLETDRDSGRLSKEEARNSLGKLNYAVLGVIGELPNNVSLAVPVYKAKGLEFEVFVRRYYIFLLAAMWGISLAIFASLFALPKRGLDIRLHATANRVECVLSQQSEIPINKPVASMQVINPHHFSSPAQSIKINEGLSERWTTANVTDGLVEIRPKAEGEPNIIVDRVNVSTIQFPAQSLVAFTVPEDSLVSMPTIQIDGKPGQLIGTLEFADSLSLECSQCALIGAENIPGSYFPWLMGQIIVPKGETYTAQIKGNEEPIRLILEPGMAGQTGSFTLAESNVAIDKLQFMRPKIGGGKKSSLLKADWEFITQGGKVYQSGNVPAQNYLALCGKTDLQIIGFQLTPKTIQLQLAGTVERLHSGPDLASPIQHNPSHMKWLWYNRRALVVLLAGLLVFVTVFLRMWVRGKGN